MRYGDRQISSKSLFLAALVAFLILVSGCDRNRQKTISITLNSTERLEETDAGWWIQELGLNYQEKYIQNEISAQLQKKGELIDKYIENKDIFVKKYRIPVKKQRLLTRDIVIIIYERSRGDSKWFTVPFGAEGLFWLNIMGKHISKGQITEQEYRWLHDSKNKPFRNAVVINSPKENGARLFLYGWGTRCMEAMLM